MKRLKDLNKPFKYIVTAVIMQKNGAGLHTATSTFWDITTDGSATVRWESKTMYCIATVRPRAATLRRGRIVLTVMRRAGLWVGDLNCVACQHAHFAMQESKTRQVVAHPTPLDEVGVEAYSLSLSVGYTDKPSTSNGYALLNTSMCRAPPQSTCWRVERSLLLSASFKQAYGHLRGRRRARELAEAGGALTARVRVL